MQDPSSSPSPRDQSKNHNNPSRRNLLSTLHNIINKSTLFPISRSNVPFYEIIKNLVTFHREEQVLGFFKQPHLQEQRGPWFRGTVKGAWSWKLPFCEHPIWKFSTKIEPFGAWRGGTGEPAGVEPSFINVRSLNVLNKRV